MSDDVADKPKEFVSGVVTGARNADPRRQRLLGHMRRGAPPAVPVRPDRPSLRPAAAAPPNRPVVPARAGRPPLPQGTAPTPPPDGYETRAQELKRKQDTVSAIARREREAGIDNMLADLPDPGCIATIRGIIAEHEQGKAAEAALFKDYDFVADLDRAAPDKRVADFTAIIDTLDTVQARCTRLSSALGEASKLPGLSSAQQDAVTAARRLQGILTESIPDEFWKERATLPARRELITATPERKREALAAETAGFPEGKGFGDRFQAIVQPHATRDFERTSFFFDRFVSAPDAKELQELGEMTAKIVAKANRIRDAGGKLADVEAMMRSTGVPEEWWPPNFVQSLQAWRQCERETLRRDAVKLCEKGSYDFKSPGDIAKFIGDQAVENGSNAKKMFATILETGEVKAAVGAFTDQLKSGFGLGEQAASALEANEFGGLDPSVARQLSDNIVAAEAKLSGVLSVAVSGLTQVGKLPDRAASVTKVLGDHVPAVTGLISDHSADIAEVAGLAASFVPGLALAVAGIKLGLALAELAKQTAMLGVAVAATDDSIARVARGELEDGFGLTYALQNEQRARGVAIGKAGVNVTTAGISMVGATAEVAGAHFGVAAKYGLEISGKVITYGSKIVFNNIDWAQATTAKELLAQARAGNPVARIELFKNSATYAKLYIAILARDRDETAVAFVEKNGIDETTIAGKANAIWILEQALRADSGQKAETDVADNWVDANTGGALSKLRSGLAVAGSVGGAVRNKVHDLAKGDGRGQSYDPDWRYTGSADVSAGTWRSAKDGAYAAGLHDDHGTGASAAVATAGTDYNAAVSLLGGDAAADPGAARVVLQKAIASLRALETVLCQWTPLSNPDKNDRQVVHAGMTEFMLRLRETARRNANQLDNELVALGIKDVNFAAAISSEPLDDKVWANNWKGAVAKACLQEDDNGMQAALGRAMQIIRARDKIDRAKDPQDWRRASLGLKAALDAVLVAAEACRRPVAEIPSMQQTVQRIVAAAAKRMADMDREMGGGWPSMPPRPTEVTAAAWKAFYDSACDGGGAKRGEGSRIADALGKLESMQAGIEKKDGNPQKQLAAEAAYRDATGQLMLATAEFLRAQRDVAQPLQEYVAAISAFAYTEQATKANAQQDRTFSAAPGLAKAAWQTSYDAAVAAGAVLANDKIRSGVSAAIDDYVEARDRLDELRVAKTYKAIRAAASGLIQALGKLTAALGQALADRGFKDNTAMADYLGARIAEVRARMTDPTLRGEADGVSAPVGSFRPPSPTWDPKEWSKAKGQAVSLGIIVDATTGMTPALQPVLDAFATLRKLVNKRPADPEALRTARDETRRNVIALRNFATGPLQLQSAHPDWAAYTAAWSKLCDNSLNSSELSAAA